MYEALVARADGESTVARMAATAASYGYEGVVVREQFDAPPEYDREAIVAAYDVDVVSACDVVTDDVSEARSAIQRARSSHELVVVRGGDAGFNRFVAERDRVDVLEQPARGWWDVDHVLVKTARDHGVRLECSLADVLGSQGGHRVRALQGLRKLCELIDHYDAPYVVSADPRSHLAVRSPRELIALGETIGFDGEWIERGLREWGRLAARSREIRSVEYVEPGVRRGGYEDENGDEGES